jgi:hypothetical protein
LVRTALTAHGDKANVVEAALWNLAVHADNKKKKKGDCIAVQPLDHRTTQHDYEQKGEKNKTPSRAKLCQ